jgi:DNA-binding beta-propeller fold protein YncE
VQHAPPFGGPPVLYEIVLKPEDVKSVQGLNALFYQGTQWLGEPVVKRRDARLEADWRVAAPLSGAFSAEWQGTLYVPAYGSYLLALTAPASARLYVDEYEALSVPDGGGVAETTMTLARGNHALRARAVGAPGAVRFSWQPPGGAREAVPTDSLYVPPVLANGLTGKYFRNTDWSGAPALEQVDPSLNLYFHVPTLPRPYTVEWTGKIAIPSAGSYAFGVESIDDSWLLMDGQPVTEAHAPNVLAEGRVTLTAGMHDIRVRFLDKSGYSHINLYWTVPGRGREPVPSERLFPPQGAYPTPVAAIPLPVTTPAPSVIPLPPGTVTQLSPLTSTLVIGGPGTSPGQFLDPRDVAVNSQGNIYVADTGNRRVQRLDAEGRPVGVIEGPFEEPLALVTDADDNLYVLDSAPGWIYRYDRNDRPTGRLGGPAAQLYHPRGLAIDLDGNLYVADTGGCRVVKLAPTGEVVAKFGSKGTGKGQFVEPTDVVVAANGLMYVADAGNRRVVTLDAAGGYVGEWAAPQSVAYNGIHLALSQTGLLLVTDPESGRLLGYDSAGRLLQQTGRKGAEPGQLATPVGVLAAADGRVYVADVGNQRVQVFH